MHVTQPLFKLPFPLIISKEKLKEKILALLSFSYSGFLNLLVIFKELFRENESTCESLVDIFYQLPDLHLLVFE